MNEQANTVLVTGAAGFIGYHLTRRLLEGGRRVIGYDNLNDFYDVGLKQARLGLLDPFENFQFFRAHLEDADALHQVFARFRPDVVVNLAAQAGVRYSITNPDCFIRSNIVGFHHLLEACRRHPVRHLVYASSSSVYGANTKMPFSPHDPTAHPVSLYAASKKTNELMAHAYSQCFGVPTTGIRFFTVYGPYGRPDMALFRFTRNILAGEPIDIYNHGQMRRNFTFVDDAVEGILRIIDRPPVPNPEWTPGDFPDPATSAAPYRVYNVGNNEPTELMDFVRCIEKEVGREAIKRFLPLQAGDILATYADISDFVRDTGYQPRVGVEEGVARFVAWYREFYGV
ncbi:MAG: NAD-dependent epimerase [Capsulimonadales bacterium]|nr:NAD-dependent epimerase [Capsulimonadales bacterium]